MKQKNIIEMARQAGFVIHIHIPTLICAEDEETWVCVNKELETFAKLVAEHEREACAKLCETYQDPFAGKVMSDAIRARGTNE
jgi:hypothetical protein